MELAKSSLTPIKSPTLTPVKSPTLSVVAKTPKTA